MSGDDDKSERHALHRRTMAGGGEVVSGGLVGRALKAVGARAMTMDHTVFVDEDFDPDDAEDQALYAHERHHQLESGGADAHDGHDDAEELAAQAIERMVLHRRRQGEGFDDILGDVEAGRIDDPSEVAPYRPAPGSSRSEQAMAGYHALREQGMPHDAVVRMLAQHVVDSLLAEQDDRDARSAGRSGVR